MNYVVVATLDEVKLVKELGLSNNPIIVTGVGGVNVIRALKDLPRDTTIFNVGYCGSNGLKVGDKVWVSEVRTHNVVASVTERPTKLGTDRIFHNFDAVPCYTSTDFVLLTNHNENCVFDMELAFICAMFDDVMSIKVVSDNLDMKQYEEFIHGEEDL